MASNSETRMDSTRRILLISYPKFVFLYPTLITSFLAGMFMWLGAPGDDATPEALDRWAEATYTTARIFMVILTLNLVVIGFDFPRTTSLTLFFAGVALLVVIWMVFRLNPTVLPWFNDNVIHAIQPRANATFYFLIAIVLSCMFIGVFISRRFDYWEVRPNELLHHHGILSDLERFSSPNLRITKEINDVFEYLLLRSGRLILHPSNERRAIVLENVFFINKRESEITRMLGALQVQVRDADS